MAWDEQEAREILQEIGALYTMHQGISLSSECRESNRRTALLLKRLENTGFSRMADRAMDLQASCHPKDLSSVRQCSAGQECSREAERSGQGSFGKSRT